MVAQDKKTIIDADSSNDMNSRIAIDSVDREELETILTVIKEHRRKLKEIEREWKKLMK